jgi:nucleoside-diphosphate-sugar epimerase
LPDASSESDETGAPWSFRRDLSDILAMTDRVWTELRGAHLLITGATGSIGCWLLEALRHADIVYGSGIRVTALTRNPAAFSRKAPHLADYENFRFVQGDVRDFQIGNHEFSHLIHAATDTTGALYQSNPLGLFDTIVDGTRHTLDVAHAAGAKRALFLSSGAVYGPQPQHVEHIPENATDAPEALNIKNVYAEGKRAAEMLCTIHGKQSRMDIVIARIFTVLGPYQALDVHFAAGNFILAAIQAKPVVVQGNGKPFRSYLYMSDLTAWLLHLLVRGRAGTAYNVGSEQAITIAMLAQRVASVLGSGDVRIMGGIDSGWNTGRYVPSTALARRELNLSMTVDLDEAIRRTALWNGWPG